MFLLFLTKERHFFHCYSGITQKRQYMDGNCEIIVVAPNKIQQLFVGGKLIFLKKVGGMRETDKKIPFPHFREGKRDFKKRNK